MAITTEEVLKTAALAYLELDNAEVEMFTHQLSTILDYIDQLKAVDVQGVPTMTHSTMGENLEFSWRHDEVRPSIGSQAATAEGPQAFGGYFRVPSVISRTGAAGEGDA
jgi:aspartyl-tRNA(Asn)/glutamyl-tRNA(Gln) amidotransferase subunit C